DYYCQSNDSSLGVLF
nr:immunoglobulin light chain junction region [Macaca mulatta]MOX78291.1 immunoglobulin light chain junction region [Macaca mulatta]MOX80930.1 immunoglobulin light chain junction region [Macaca mulatta]MOX82862.1 immunoglobulin light chain junction region [Macaca mulatta]MOX83843.1 immunoglobulin light chain junction region [Macaca mulatta]